MPNRAGFTGTRQGMTPQQEATVAGLLHQEKVEIADHGGCVGADIDFDELCWTYQPRSIIVSVHPSNLKHQQGKWHYTPYLCLEKPPLERNRDIVDKSNFLIATPKEYIEVLRSGTWATIRYARKQKKPIYIVRPDGFIVREVG